MSIISKVKKVLATVADDIIASGSECSVTIRQGNREVIASGDTIEDALTKAAETIGKINFKCVIFIEANGKTFERQFMAPQMRRILQNYMTRKVWGFKFNRLLK